MASEKTEAGSGRPADRRKSVARRTAKRKKLADRNSPAERGGGERDGNDRAERSSAGQAQRRSRCPTQTPTFELLHHHHRPGSPRAAGDSCQTVLRLQYAIWGPAEHADLPRLYRYARRSARSESEGLPAGIDDGGGPELPNTSSHQVGSQKLLLPGFAQGIPDQPVRPADVPRWLSGYSGCQRRFFAQAGRDFASAPGGRCGQKHARRGGRPGRQPYRPESVRYAAPGNRQPARYAVPGRSQGLPDRTEIAADLPGSLRLQHAGRQPAGRCQRELASPARRPTDRNADRGSEEYEQLPSGRTGAGL